MGVLWLVGLAQGVAGALTDDSLDTLFFILLAHFWMVITAMVLFPLKKPTEELKSLIRKYGIVEEDSPLHERCKGIVDKGRYDINEQWLFVHWIKQEEDQVETEAMAVKERFVGCHIFAAHWGVAVAVLIVICIVLEIVL